MGYSPFFTFNMGYPPFFTFNMVNLHFHPALKGWPPIVYHYHFIPSKEYNFCHSVKKIGSFRQKSVSFRQKKFSLTYNILLISSRSGVSEIVSFLYIIFNYADSPPRNGMPENSCGNKIILCCVLNCNEN